MISWLDLLFHGLQLSEMYTRLDQPAWLIMPRHCESRSHRPDVLMLSSANHRKAAQGGTVASGELLSFFAIPGGARENVLAMSE